MVLFNPDKLPFETIRTCVMIVISCDTIKIAVEYGVLSGLLGCQSLQISLAFYLRLQNGRKAFQPVFFFPVMVLRLRLIEFPQRDITASNDPSYPDNRISILLFPLVHFGKIIKLNVKINSTLKSLH